MSAAYFITATGTGVGKTFITTSIAYQYTQGGYGISVIKPIISGFNAEDSANDSALILRSMGRPVTPEAMAKMSPWQFSSALSPHLAARKEGANLELAAIAAFCRTATSEAHVTLIEGAGGVMSPLNEDATMLDLMMTLEAKILLVAGSYLGSITHTLTALQVLPAHKLHAVIVSQSAECAGLAETADSIRQFAKPAVPVYTVPRVEPCHEPWKICPSLSELCLNPK